MAEVFGGLDVGIALGVYGLGFTAFETGGDVTYYIPNTYLRLVISALLIGRIAYRLNPVWPSGGNPFNPATFDPASSGQAGFQRAYDPVSGTILFISVVLRHVLRWIACTIQAKRRKLQ